MTTKLEGGDLFPRLPLQTVDGEALVLPGEPACEYLVVLFYRGAF